LANFAASISYDGKTMPSARATKDINGNQNDNSAMGAGAVYIFSNP